MVDRVSVIRCSCSFSLFVWPRAWWILGACAIGVSMFAIVHSWKDAKFGALANGQAGLVGVLFGFLSQGPTSLRAVYEHDVDRALERSAPESLITESDLGHLPVPVQQYLRRAGVVGQPRVHNFRVRMHGRIRNAPDGRWMYMTAEQFNFVEEPARFFYLNASMFMVPAQGYHRYAGPSANMLVKAAALVPVVDAAGREMDQSETVTMFNDMCIMAPATLIDPAISWDTIDARTVRATFTNAGHTIRAELSFSESGDSRISGPTTAISSPLLGDPSGRRDGPLRSTPIARSVRIAWHPAAPAGGTSQVARTLHRTDLRPYPVQRHLALRHSAASDRIGGRRRLRPGGVQVPQEAQGAARISSSRLRELSRPASAHRGVRASARRKVSAARARGADRRPRVARGRPVRRHGGRHPAAASGRAFRSGRCAAAFPALMRQRIAFSICSRELATGATVAHSRVVRHFAPIFRKRRSPKREVFVR